MDTPLSQISSLIPLIEKIAADKAMEIVNAQMSKDQYSVAKIPDHHHNGTDSVQLETESVAGFQVLPSNPGDMLAPSTLGNQFVQQGDKTVGYGSTASGTFIATKGSFTTLPATIIYGGGSSTPLTMTGSPAIGATSATLTGAYGGTTGTYATAFASTEIKNVTFTNGSTAITWSTGLELTSGGTGLSLNGASTFNGGDAPIGTVVIFSSELSLFPQLWVRVGNGAVAAKWWGIDFTTGIWGLTA